MLGAVVYLILASCKLDGILATIAAYEATSELLKKAPSLIIGTRFAHWSIWNDPSEAVG